MINRLFINSLALVALLLGLGCAATNPQGAAPDWQAPLADQSQTLKRLELRMEEVTRNLLVLRERVAAVEKAQAERGQAQSPAVPPTLTVVKLQPPAAVPEAAVTGAGESDPAVADLYRKAFNAYREGRYGEAILDFEEFLRGNPNHEYADNAQYWIGESYYSQSEYEQAVVEFNRVLERYPREAKASDALLKIGMAYVQLGQPERSRVFWERLVNQYPHSEAAREAQKRLSAAP